MAPRGEESDLLGYLAVLRRRKWTIGFVVVLAVGAVLAYSFAQTPRYTATAKVLIQPNGAPPQLNGSSATTALQPSDIETQVQLITSAPVQAAVTRKLGSAPSVSVNPVGQTDLISVASTSPDRHQAAAIANAYVDAYVDYRRTQAVNSLVAASEQIQTKITDLDSQIAALNARVSSVPASQQAAVAQSVAPQRTALSDQEAAFKAQLAQLQLSSAVQTGAAEVVRPAAVPSSPSSPRTLRNALLAAGIGLLLGIGAAYLRDYLDDSVRTKEDLERTTPDLPVLGMVPVVTSWKDEHRTKVVSLSEPASSAAESYRALRTSMKFASLDSPLRMLQVTSPSAGEGKSATVANLAVAFAAADQRVIIACCDLRRPRIHEFFGLSNKIGLTSVLLGDVPLKEAIQRVPGEERLAVLASGPRPASPAEVFDSRQSHALLEETREQADIVLLDCPPVLPVTDAAALSAQVDATLLVVVAGGTTSRLLARSLEVLGQVRAPVVGTVLNCVTEDDVYGDAYRYRYYGADPHAEENNGSPRGVAHGAGLRQKLRRRPEYLRSR